MATWLEKLRKVDQRNKEQEKLAREMTHRPQADIETLRGRDPLTDWALGVRERTLNPLATLAGEAKRFKGLSPEEMGMELVGGGMVGGLYKTTGLANRGRELIQGEAGSLAKRLDDAGVQYQLQHSGSQAGPSSYIKVAGMPDIRFSGHDKGVFGSQGVVNVSTPEEIEKVYNQAVKNQTALNKQLNEMSENYEQKAIIERLKSADKKMLKGKGLTKSEQDAVDSRSLNMTSEQRLHNYPPSMFDVPMENQIVRMRDLAR